MTQAQEKMLWNYKRSTAKELWHVYGTWSAEKAQAFQNCNVDRMNLDGYDARICSANSWQFTYAFRYMLDGVEHLRYHTARNVYDFELEEDE